MLPSGLEMSPPSIAVTAEILGKEKAFRSEYQNVFQRIEVQVQGKQEIKDKGQQGTEKMSKV